MNIHICCILQLPDNYLIIDEYWAIRCSKEREVRAMCTNRSISMKQQMNGNDVAITHQMRFLCISIKTRVHAIGEIGNVWPRLASRRHTFQIDFWSSSNFGNRDCRYRPRLKRQLNASAVAVCVYYKFTWAEHRSPVAQMFEILFHHISYEFPDLTESVSGFPLIIEWISTIQANVRQSNPTMLHLSHDRR